MLQQILKHTITIHVSVPSSTSIFSSSPGRGQTLVPLNQSSWKYWAQRAYGFETSLRCSWLRSSQSSGLTWLHQALRLCHSQRLRLRLLEESEPVAVEEEGGCGCGCHYSSIVSWWSHDARTLTDGTGWEDCISRRCCFCSYANRSPCQPV